MLYIIIIIIFMMFLNVLTKMKKKNILLTALLAVLCFASSIQAAEAANPIQPVEIGSTGQLQQLSQLFTINNGKKLLNEGVKGLTVAASWLLPKLPKLLNIPYFTINAGYSLPRFLSNLGFQNFNLYERLGFLGTLLSTTLSSIFLVDAAIQVLKQPNRGIRGIILVAYFALYKAVFKCLPESDHMPEIGFNLMFICCNEILLNGVWNTLKIMCCLPLFLNGAERLINRVKKTLIGEEEEEEEALIAQQALIEEEEEEEEALIAQQALIEEEEEEEEALIEEVEQEAQMQEEIQQELKLQALIEEEEDLNEACIHREPIVDEEALIQAWRQQAPIGGEEEELIQ
ncbi:MAG: hypothetical protein LBS83_03060, partial [Holosporales bacterium]|nr:hypothetical protein [Holosporales bacterium]